MFRPTFFILTILALFTVAFTATVDKRPIRDDFPVQHEVGSEMNIAERKPIKDDLPIQQEVGTELQTTDRKKYKYYYYGYGRCNCTCYATYQQAAQYCGGYCQVIYGCRYGYPYYGTGYSCCSNYYY